ncbi:MAG TPA: thiamine pyrophosphate-binding protein [Xanthobacteraceae bacterium]|jgi:thiamine pyrophosphate-dependent acetolactate synthase large subunit-like protein|nr:thiamine pyrophosphate-binding protein [Xanthobacteraceae bacterium]
MQFDRPEGKPDGKVGFGSDVAAQMMRRIGISYIALTPGASYRGFHDSVVNHLGNENPGMLLCLHEDHAVAIAHGYAKVTGKPMGCALHSNVGLMHGMMSIYNAWCDRVPMIIIGATGPLDSAKRRPWIDWIHTTRDQGALVRDMVKWDDLPSSPEAIVEGFARANIITRTAPTGPVYICLDAELQEEPLKKDVEFPDLNRLQPPPPARPTKDVMTQAKDILEKGKKIVMLIGRGARTQEAWDARIKLAERLGACVMSDLKTGSVFPTEHAAQFAPPFNVISKPGRDLLCEADVILALDWVDLGGALKQAKSAGKVNAKVISATLDYHLHGGFNMDYQGLPAIDVFMACEGDVATHELNDVLGAGKKEPWKARIEAKKRTTDMDGKPTIPQLASTLRAAINDPEQVSFTSLCRGFPLDIWPLSNPHSFLGKDGGGGIGSAPGIAIGAAVALNEMGKMPICITGDGDFIMGINALWTAVHHKIPMLVLINNNRSYFNDELHQETIARVRGREPKNRWIGQRIADPSPDIAKFAEAQGAMGIGPITKASDVKDAIDKGLAALKAGKVCVIDFHIDPGEDRMAGAALGHRETGGAVDIG